MTEPIGSVTGETLQNIAAEGVWAGGLTYTPAVLRVARALLATAQGSATGVLPPELQQPVDKLRAAATVNVLRIPAHDEAQLSALSIKLNTQTPSPVVVMPAGWSPYGWLPFVWTYFQLALDGYHVLAYTPRGIGQAGLISTSTGYIDVGGPNDWADGVTVLDYAVETFEPSAIGMLGESYGSGLSQLVAAHDPANRVRAVVALSTWGNLATSMYDNGTRHLAAVDALIAFTGGPEEDKFDERTREILAKFRENRDMEDVVDWGTERSPAAYLDQTNSRGIPTFMSNTWHESLFPVNQVLDTYNRLTVPKRLNLWIGDHGAPEGVGLVGVPLGIAFPGMLTPMREARDWVNHYLRGTKLPEREPVANQIMFTYKTKPVSGGAQRITEAARREFAYDWSPDENIERLFLGDGVSDGILRTKEDTGWSRTFTVGQETKARAVDAPLTTGQDEWFGNPKVYQLNEFERDLLQIWLTEPLTDGRMVHGTPTVRLTVASTTTEATLVAYLFDVAADNTARIITHEPCTVTGLTPGEGRTVEWLLQSACYEIPEGHRLALVVNSRDPLYSYTETRDKALHSTTITSPENEESYLDLPLPQA
ncbi:CocE/NonD family hydrolase [Nocardia sp. NPDC057663]|uniref:CocE/NonD family hydrolase n=1 Tax=Nocardia sp. NPDC057663 TaxID=3346201 RepID=UPI00367025CE